MIYPFSEMTTPKTLLSIELHDLAALGLPLILSVDLQNAVFANKIDCFGSYGQFWRNL